MFQPTYQNLFAQSIPTTWYEVGLLPIFFSIVGAILWIGGKVTELKSGKKSYWKFLAIPLLVLALWVGFQAFRDTMDIFYDEAIRPHGRKMKYMHYAAFIFPLLVLIGIGVWELVDRRAAKLENRF